MRIYYFVRCDCMSVLNICALTSDLFMAQFRHGLASLFHTRSLNNIVKHWTAREEKLNWIPSIFTDIRARARDRHTHSVLKQKRKIFACKWYISSDEPWIRIGVCMWAYNFYSFSFFLSVNRSVLFDSLAQCISSNGFTVQICSRCLFFAANEPEPFVIYLLFIIKHLIIVFTQYVLRWIVAREQYRRFLMSLFFFSYNGHIIC